MSEIRRIPNENATTMITTGWKILKGSNYGVLLGASLFMLVVAAAIAKVPYLGVLAAVPTVYIGAGHLFIVRKILQGESVKFTDVFHAFENPRWMNALIPVAVSGVAIALVQLGLEKMGGEGNFVMSMFGGLISIFLILLWYALTAFSVPLITFKGRSFGESIDMNLKATTLNWVPLLIFSFMMLGVALLCTIALVLPLFFVLFPLLNICSYLGYAAIFEDLDLVAVGKMFDSKPPQA